MADKARKGRAARGEGHPQAKLTRNDVAEILDMRAVGLLQREIAERFGVCQAHVSDILNGHFWKERR